MRHVCVLGCAAGLAAPVIDSFLADGYFVSGVSRKTRTPRDHEHYVEFVGLPEQTLLHLLAPIDVLVTMPGEANAGRLRGWAGETCEKVIANNLTVVLHALRTYPVRDGGNVVIVGSVQSRRGFGCADYAAAKAGLVGLVKAVSAEWAGADIMVNVLELGYIDAGMGARLPDKPKARAAAEIPLGRFGTPADVVGAVRYLADVRYMTGSVLSLAGGL